LFVAVVFLAKRIGETWMRLIYVAFFAAGIVARGRGHAIYVSFLAGTNHRVAVTVTILIGQNHRVGAWFRTLGSGFARRVTFARWEVFARRATIPIGNF
jgi:hypothetical protein